MRFSRDPGRPLTAGERQVAEGLFGPALDLDRIRLHCAKWWPFQPRFTVMAPDGDIWFPPSGSLWREDYAAAELPLQALFAHELTHCWQHQSGLFLPLRRHPFCRYAYEVVPGRPLESYGIEQQAMIVQHAFLARTCGAPDPMLEEIVAQAGLRPLFPRSC